MYVLGLHIDNEYLRCALVSRRGKNIQILALEGYEKGCFKLDQIEREVLSPHGLTLSSQNLHITSTLSCADVMLRHLELPFKRERELYKALPFQIESFFPFDEKEGEVIPIVKKGKKSSKVSLYGLQDSAMKRFLERAHQVGFDPETIAPAPKALACFCSSFLKDQGSILHFHFGWEESQLLIYVEGTLVTASKIDIGLSDFFAAIYEESPKTTTFDVDCLKAHLSQMGSETSTLYALIERFHAGVKRILASYHEKYSCGAFPMLFTGYVDEMGYISSLLGGLNASTLQITSRGEFEQKTLSMYALEIGMCLNVLQGKPTVQLRQGAFASLKQKKKLGKKLFNYTVCLGLMTAGLYVYSWGLLKESRDAFKEEFTALLEKPQFEKFDEKRLNRGMHTPTKYAKALSLLARDLDQHLASQTLVKPAPKFSQALNLLEGIIEKQKGIKVRDVHYQLVSHPSLKKLRAKVARKITLRFALLSSADVQLFYKDCVDAKCFQKVGKPTYHDESREYEIAFEI